MPASRRNHPASAPLRSPTCPCGSRRTGRGSRSRPHQRILPTGHVAALLVAEPLPAAVLVGVESEHRAVRRPGEGGGGAVPLTSSISMPSVCAARIDAHRTRWDGGRRLCRGRGPTSRLQAREAPGITARSRSAYHPERQPFGAGRVSVAGASPSTRPGSTPGRRGDGAAPRLRLGIASGASTGASAAARSSRAHAPDVEEADGPTTGRRRRPAAGAFGAFLAGFDAERAREAGDMVAPAELYAPSARPDLGLPKLAFPPASGSNSAA